jgi:predicted TIM-barrel fold metal-dependent hydrolase
MDDTGVDVQILNPTQGGQLLGREFKDPGLLVALCRAYNDWSAEYCSASPERLRWIAMIPLQDIEAAIEETRRAARLGAVGFYARPNPLGGRQIFSRDYFPLWAAMEAEGRPLSVHDTGSPQLESYGDRMQTHTTGHILAHPLETMVSMMALIWYGIPEHFPAFHIVHVEGDSGWLPYLMQRMEQHYDFAGNSEHPDLTMRPTEYFERNVFVAARGDERTLPATVELVGDRNLMLNTDYPHADGHWPASLDAFDKQPLSEESQTRILGTNAVRAFGLEDEFKNHPGYRAEKKKGLFSFLR